MCGLSASFPMYRQWRFTVPVQTILCPPFRVHPFASALPGFVFFYWYWFIVAVFFMYGGALKDVILVRCIRSECASTVCVPVTQ